MRQRLLWATCIAAIAAGTGSALAMPLGAARPIAGATPVQFWGDWGPRYERPYVEPDYGRRYITPDDDDEDVGPIAPQRAIVITRSMGYRAISRPRLAGRAWVVDAVGPQGQRTQVRINAYTGAPLAIRELEPGGQRFPTPPVWRDERPSFGRDGGQDFREGRLDNDPMRPDARPDQRPERPARAAPNITARIVPVPTPRPDIDGGLQPQPQVMPPVASPPPAEAPAPQPPAASLPPRNVTPVAPTSPLSVEPSVPFTPPAAPAPQAAPAPAEPPTAALPQTTPDAGPREEQPTVVAPPAPAVVAPPVEATTPAQPAEPPAAALPTQPAPVAPPAAAPAPVIEAPPVQAAPATPTAPAADAAARPAPSQESEGVMIDGRFLGPNGEALPSGPGQTSPGVRQVVPPPSGN
ncbi:MAG: hypothetical protein LCH88_07190 [Proteobacteria bacterium]|nr:hypothetical protein [Pseudomonadota bacterium]